jgi:hypothetical protein
MHYAVAHMGAKYDHELGLVDATGKPLDTTAIRAHMRGPEGVGGRTLAFTSDRPKAGSAYYVPSERRPLPETAKNTLFAYSHGLTDPGHQSLLEQHVRMQGVVDAHKAVNRTLQEVALQKPTGGYWNDYRSAKLDAPPGYKPVALAQPFHPQAALDQAMEHVDPANIESEAQLRHLDLSQRIGQDVGPAKYGLVSDIVQKRVNEHKAQIGSYPALRGFKAANNQFRKVALSTSPKHIPGVMSENLLRDAASGVGVASWITGKRVLSNAEKINPEAGRLARVQMGGGQMAGATEAAMTHQVSSHFAGTNIHPVLKSIETALKTPGIRQMRSAWNNWAHFAIGGTKKLIEENQATAALGKAVLQDFGSTHGAFAKAVRLQGQMLDDASKGLFDQAKARQLRATVERIDGRWTDLTPSGQAAMMLTPFGLWWSNSVQWLARLPIDHPIKTGIVAGATVGTQQERQAKGLDLFSPGAVPGYEQGAIPIGGKLLAQNYYSPFGVANDPIETAGSLLVPWLQGPLLAGLGDNYLGRPLSSPKDPHGRKPANAGERGTVILNSILSNFIPLYTKAQTIAQGGQSAYDTSGLLTGTQTKKPGKGFAAGLTKAATPYRLYNNVSLSAPNSGGSSSGGVDPTTGLPFASPDGGSVSGGSAGGASSPPAGGVDPTSGLPFAP